ncbi:MAG: tetratricopeptide repeat protein, partial [Candidatus Aminicenantes bacterium]|nr:tetratricopeptide repeat protein [Candidatus Aminicenantes bacterium]
PRPASDSPSRESFRESFERGVALFNRGEYDGAAAALSRALTHSPGSAVALNLLGICRFQQKNFPAARALFERAAAADASYAQAHNNLGGVFFVQGEYDRAEAALRKALEINPGLVSALYSLGNLYLSRDRFDEGLAVLAKAVTLAPDYLETHQALITQTPQEGFRSTEAHVLYARLFAEAGDLTRTLSYLERAERSGFKDWERIAVDVAFDKVRDAPAFQDFLRARLKF